MERVCAASFEITLLRRRDDEGEQPDVRHERAHGMHAWPSIRTNCCEECETDAVLIQQRPALRREVWLLPSEITPRDHATSLPHDRELGERRSAPRLRYATP